jgi:hypothetical protein
MRRLWLFVGRKHNREILTWIGGGLAVAAAGLWTTLLHFSAAGAPPAAPPGIEARCGSIGIGGDVTGATITAGNAGSCPERKP